MRLTWVLEGTRQVHPLIHHERHSQVGLSRPLRHMIVVESLAYTSTPPFELQQPPKSAPGCPQMICVLVLRPLA